MLGNQTEISAISYKTCKRYINISNECITRTRSERIRRFPYWLWSGSVTSIKVEKYFPWFLLLKTKLSESSWNKEGNSQNFLHRLQVVDRSILCVTFYAICLSFLRFLRLAYPGVLYGSTISKLSLIQCSKQGQSRDIIQTIQSQPWSSTNASNFESFC